MRKNSRKPSGYSLKPFVLTAFFAAACFSSLQADSHTQPHADITLTKTSKLICDHDAIDTKGFSMCKVSFRFDVTTDDEDIKSADVTCEAVFDYTTRKFPAGTSETKRATKNIALEDKTGNGKIYISWRRIMDTATDVKIAKTSCNVEKLHLARSATTRQTPPPEPAQTPHVSIQQESAPETLSPPETTEVPKADPSPRMELELLKEKNRAKELEIKALELKIKLKEMEQ